MTPEDGGLFAWLAHERPDLAPVLDRLAAERRTMAALLDELRVVLATPVAGPDALGREVDRLTGQVRAHLAYEEEQLVPILNAAGGDVAAGRRVRPPGGGSGRRAAGQAAGRRVRPPG
ncbi:hemerythrin domain-containing protein, partial [Micromonospora psammae]|uniref:hemerythrin domain-containing protein n=1 Tax=Micromonospora sp. CPCC 205556 TaxID=3122398 RepID=UPI002FF05CB8